MPAVNPNAAPVSVTPATMVLPLFRVTMDRVTGAVALTARLVMAQVNGDGSMTEPNPPIEGAVDISDLNAEIATIAADTENGGPAVAQAMQTAMASLLTAITSYANYQEIPGFTGLVVQ